MKDRILQFLIRIGRKCKPLTYPVMVVVVAFLTVYHALRNLLTKARHHKLKAGVVCGLALFALVGTLLVLPSLADEMEGEPQTETVSEEELEPTMTPEVTVKPIETEIPDTPEPEAEPEETQEPQDEVKDDDEPSATATPEMASGSETSDVETAEEPPIEEETKKTPKRVKEAAPPVQLERPSCSVVEEPVGPFTYPLDSVIRVKVQATAPEGAGLEYQWYVSRSAGGTGERLEGHGAQTSTYSIQKGIGAGDYYYYCVVKSVDNDGYNLDSEEVRSDDIVVSIAKGQPEVDDFDLSTIKDEYYYTGEVIDPSIVSSKEGMGDAYIVVMDGSTEIRPKAESDDPYSIYLHISEGDNYKKRTIDLGRTITIKRYPTPAKPYTIDGKKGKLVDGKQWYTTDVKIVPKSGFTISATGTDFQEALTYSADGTNQGPLHIYLKNIQFGGITEAITVTEKRDGQINIDKTNPVGTITYEGNSYNNTGHESGEGFYNHDVVFNLSAEDAASGVADRWYVFSQNALTDSQLKTANWKTWGEGDTVDMAEDDSCILYAKMEDKAGNVGYTATDRVTIDLSMPVIQCGGKTLGDEKSYIADKKKIVVSDSHLIKVTVRRNSNVVLTKSGDDIVDNATSFQLERPDGIMEDVTFEITAEDAAGNEKITRVTLKNPILDVEAADMDFGSGDDALIYGYEAVEAKSVVMTNKADGQLVAADSLELELAEGTDSNFEVVDGNKVRPKQGLHAGSYTEVVRIYYNGEAESTTTCKCSVTVDKANMLVSYAGQKDVGYHTLPDLTGTIEYAQADFKNGDTKEVFASDPDFVAPKLYYQSEDSSLQEYTSDKRAMESMQLIPDGGQSGDYIFSYAAGELEVKQHILRNGYVIEGEKVEGHDWYVSSNVAIRPAANFQISESQEADSFATAAQLISVAGPTNGEEKAFYVMNKTTGEISALMKETIKIDNTAPYFRNGEGITVSSNLWAEFCNSISFGMFYNNTKAVSIRATDEESGLESIRYCVSPVAVDGNSEALETQLSWQDYDDGFSISPDDYEKAIIYAKITNHAGLVTYISSNGLVFDNKQPDINKVEGGREQGIIDEKEYITENLSLKVTDSNLEEVTLYEGTNVTVSGSALTITGEPEQTRQAVKDIPCPDKGSKTYTVVARDYAGNNAEREFTVTKPIYDINANTLKIKDAEYGYASEPQTAVTWENTEMANADATISRIKLSNDRDFEVKQSDNSFWIAAKQGLPYGKYTTDVTLVYNGGKEAQTTCSFVVNKATLTAVYTGDDLYYHEKIEPSSVKVTGFVTQNGVQETPETASGYQAPTVDVDGVARETKELTPSGGKADNYTFRYQSGLLLVDRRYAKTGKDGQYVVDGKISDTGWYTSDITIRPKEGYALLYEEDQEPQESICLTEDTDSGEQAFYVMRKDTGEIFYKSLFDYKRDSVIPSIEGIEKDATYEANSREVTVQDENLSSVTVNGKTQTIEHGKAKFRLTADQETMVYVVVATDCAGNMNDMSVVLNQPASLPVPEDEDDIDISPSPSPSTSASPGDSDETMSSGTVKKSVKVVEGAPNTALTTSTNDLKTSVLSNGEQQAVEDGSNANIELRIKNIDSSVSQTDKELVIASLGGYYVGEYLDITLWKKVGNSSESKVTSISNPISVTVSVPSSLRGASREFAVLRVHNGSVSILKDQDSAANTVTFRTDRFSTYALAYKTTAEGSSSGRTSDSSGSSSRLMADASPETGDEAPLLPVGITFFVALAGIVTTMVVRRRI